MAGWLRISLAMTPWALVLLYWLRRYRAKSLRIRLMALTAGLGTFLSLTIQSLLLSFSEDGYAFTLADFGGHLVIASAFGMTFLAWWPILKKGLRRKNILW